MLLLLFMEGNHFSDVGGDIKAKKFLYTKSLFSPFFGQKLVFLVKPTYVLLPIDEEWKKVETKVFFSDERRESTL